MKYLAILKDSWREALDTKVFYAMLAISLLLILVVASIGFRPAEAEDALAAIVADMQSQMIRPERGQSGTMFAKRPLHANLRMSNAKQLNDAPTPSARDYSFTITATENWPFAFHEAVDFWNKPTPADFRFGRQEFRAKTANPNAVSDKLLEEFIQQHLVDSADLTVEKVSLRVLQTPNSTQEDFRAGQYAFDIHTKGRSGTKGWPHFMSLFFGLVDPQGGPFRDTVGSWVFFIENLVVNNIGGWVTLMIGVVITAFFIPNMLRKGTIDMLLAKPIHRPTLLVYKYIGGLVFMFLSSLAAIGGVWVVIGLRSGIWEAGFFLTVFTLTFFFAILYSVSTLFSVLTRSPIVSILATLVFWLILWVLGQVYTGLVFVSKEPALKTFKDGIPAWVFTTSDVVHYVLPRTSDLSVLNTYLVGAVLTDQERRDKGYYTLPDVSWMESIAVSIAFISVMLGIACWRFSRKDY